MPGGADEQQRGADVLWSVQVDAAAGVEVVDEGRRRRSSGARGHCEEEDEDEEARGKMKRTPVPIYREMEKRHARESRRPKMIIWLH